MATIDLGASSPTPAWSDVPRRLSLTLPELELAAERAGGAPLPFVAAPVGDTSDLAARLGDSHADAASAFASARAALNDPATSLERRGLSDDAGLAGALGLLATPHYALDLDLVADGVRARAWHRQADGALATLATVDGLVFELGWGPTSAWPSELARVATLAEPDRGVSAVPAELDLPYALLDAAAEALRSGRPDLVPVLASGFESDPETRVLTALVTEARGRLRVLAADVGAAQTVGVVSWSLLTDGWHALRPHLVDGELWVSVVAVSPDDLAAELAPVLAELAR